MRQDMIVQEVLRYLGVPKNQAEESLIEEIHRLYEEVIRKSTPKYVKQINNLTIQDRCTYFVQSGLNVKSTDLAKVLANSKQCYLLAVTLGTSIDLLIKQRQYTKMSEAVILDACASVYIEQICDQVEEEIMETLEKKQYMTMRYSPGYGDVSLDIQEQLLEALEATKRIGLGLSRSQMLLPSKSVTAFIGISTQKEKRLKTCGACMLQKTCMYRKRGERCGN